MTISSSHLSEMERHGLADGSLDGAALAAAKKHLGGCADCAADVERLTGVVSTLRVAATQTVSPTDDDWPDLRARLERQKVVPLGRASRAVPSAARQFPRLRWVAVPIAALFVIGVGLTLWLWSASRSSTHTAGTASLAVVAESTQAYQDEARALLNRLELQRAMLRPETAASIDKSLRLIDGAIAELEDAVARDPNNPELRRMLALSYRQKVDLLKRAENAS